MVVFFIQAVLELTVSFGCDMPVPFVNWRLQDCIIVLFLGDNASGCGPNDLLYFCALAYFPLVAAVIVKSTRYLDEGDDGTHFYLNTLRDWKRAFGVKTNKVVVDAVVERGGSKIWWGKIVVSPSASPGGFRGCRVTDPAPGQWRVGDTIHTSE